MRQPARSVLLRGSADDVHGSSRTLRDPLSRSADPGPESDGDTIKFRPDTPGLVETIPRPSGRPPDLNARGISVRLEAIDALETHFAETHQDLAGANAARDALLARLGFTNVVYFPDQPNRVQSADADELVGTSSATGSTPTAG